MHSLLGLTDVALVISVSLACGLLLEYIKQPAVLGYILAGVLLGPSCLALITDKTIVNTLADLGVLILLFLVGMELSLRGFKRVWLVALATTFLQITVSLLLAFGLSFLFGWSSSFSILLGFLIALSSTAVTVKALENTHELKTAAGKLTLGILIAQDLAIVPMILILRNLESRFMWQGLLIRILISIGVLGLLVWYLSRRQQVRIPFTKIFANNVDLTPLVGLVFCFGFATLSSFLDLSAAYGAFLAGLILGNSSEKTVMIQTMTPIYSVLMMVFFLSIGLLMDLSFIWNNFTRIFILLLLITFGKTFFNIIILHVLKQPWGHAFLASVVLAQLGEFSFVLTSIGHEANLLEPYQEQLIITLTALSLAFGPLWLVMARRLRKIPLQAQSTFFQVIRRLCTPEYIFCCCTWKAIVEKTKYFWHLLKRKKE